MNNRSSNGAIAHSQPFIPGSDRSSGEIPAIVLRWLELFHLWDFIFAPQVNGKAQWRTDRRYPLNTHTLYKRWQDSDKLVGVRFSTNRGGSTTYALLDIDIHSAYHPANNESPLQEILSALESIGLCRCIRIRSSTSGGLHLYFPLSKAKSCTSLAKTVQDTLSHHGFDVKAGQLEIFPNVRSSGKRLYNGHRLPLQTGSYVLDKDWQPIHNSLEQLAISWQWIAEQQDMDALEQAIAHCRSRKSARSKDAEEWRFRLETTLQEGWTQYGQTNDILRDLCIYARVFKGLEWEDVESWVLRTAPSLPGYRRFCRHQRTLERRIRDWVGCDRNNNRYFPIGSKTKPKSPKGPTNTERATGALQRIKAAIASLIAKLGSLPKTVKQRLQLICQEAHCSAATLYKHQEIWHPEFGGKGCLPPGEARVSTVSTTVEAIANETLGCVTPDETEVTALSIDSVQNLDAPQSLTQQGVTHHPLLSVLSSSESRLKRQSPEASFDFQVGTIVRRKKHRSTFRIKKVNENGMICAKCLNETVSSVDVVLRLDELEEIEAPKLLSGEGEDTMVCNAATSQRNGAKSRGPRTARGKAISARNATKHGLLAQKPPLLAGEDLATFRGLVQSLVEHYQPQGPVEWHLVQTIAMGMQRQHRLWAAEVAVGNAQTLPAVEPPYTEQTYPQTREMPRDAAWSDCHPINLAKERQLLSWFITRHNPENFPQGRCSKGFEDIWTDWVKSICADLRRLADEYPTDGIPGRPDDSDAEQFRDRFHYWLRDLWQQNHPYAHVCFYRVALKRAASPKNRGALDYEQRKYCSALEAFQNRLEQIDQIQQEVAQEAERYRQDLKVRQALTANPIPKEMALLSRYEAHIAKQLREAIAQLQDLQKSRATKDPMGSFGKTPDV